ncbi:UDP-glucose 4-epimerase [hydrothermal vent metagenome]|uniref:UDP-glucose 4-epimerase n=1 Tax=hydrothermal vent metagenome TaxID=652676 RepID=A0A3B0QNQ1_9ZZZZ
MGRAWLITGGAGFIGTSLIEALLAAGDEPRIRVLDNLSVGTREDLREVCDFRETSLDDLAPPTCGVELVVGDITDSAACLAACSDIDVVVHLAANTGVGPSVEDPVADMKSNVIGTFNMLEGARGQGVASFVFASSGAPIGEVEPPIDENKPARPVSPYGASKLAGEGYCSAYFKSFGVKTVALRFGNIYGTRSAKKESVVAKFIKRALGGETLEIYGDGTQTRDFIYIDDLTDAIRLGAATDRGGEVFQIATHKETTVSEIATLISALIKQETGRQVQVVHKGARIGDVMRNYSDISKARRVLGFEPKWTIEEGLKKTLRWYLNEKQSV